jgi:hypothetical protein
MDDLHHGAAFVRRAVVSDHNDAGGKIPARDVRGGGPEGVVAVREGADGDAGSVEAAAVAAGQVGALGLVAL